jgi:hypothetical protein
MLAALIALVLATLASGATAALYAYRFRYYRRLSQSLQRRESNHLATIFLLQDQLKTPENFPITRTTK